MRIRLGQLRRAIREELDNTLGDAEGEYDSQYDYGIPPDAKVCPSVPTASSTDVVVPDIDDWQDKVKLPVPLLHQASSFSCGAACTLALFLYWMPNDAPYETEYDLWPVLETTEENGTEPRKMVEAMVAEGLEASYGSEFTLDEVRKHVDAGKTVILCFQAWPGRRLEGWEFTWADGHYSIVVGMDDDNVYIMDPSTHGSYVWMPNDELVERWHDVDEGVPKQGIAIVVGGSDPRRDFPGSLKRLC